MPDPMEVDSPAGNGVKRVAGGPQEIRLGDNIFDYQVRKAFRRDDIKDRREGTHVLSLDLDDPSELLLTTDSDETLHLYNVVEGRKDKMLMSKKYGAKLGRFTHNSSSILYASTKQNHAIRYLATHDNTFIRYFEGHEKPVTSLTVHPGSDNFISSSHDAFFVWDLRTKNYAAQLMLRDATLTAYDPSGQVFAVACPSVFSILLYDVKNLKAPFAMFDVLRETLDRDQTCINRNWTTMTFTNDSRYLVLGTKGDGHLLLDAFTGELRAYLKKTEPGPTRLAAGEEVFDTSSTWLDRGRVRAKDTANRHAFGGENEVNESSADIAVTPDGRFVIGGGKSAVSIWDIKTASMSNEEGPSSDAITLSPITMLTPPSTLEGGRESAVVAFSPRYNFMATADSVVLFWRPDVA